MRDKIQAFTSGITGAWIACHEGDSDESLTQFGRLSVISTGKSMRSE